MSGAHHSEGHDSQEGPGHLTARGYLTGFGLAAVLTIIPFWLVMDHVLSGLAAGVLVMGLAAVQVVVHMIYFLHMDSRAEGGWTVLALLFTVLLVGIVLSGSLWVMHHLDVNMMPMTAQEARVAP